MQELHLTLAVRMRAPDASPHSLMRWNESSWPCLLDRTSGKPPWKGEKGWLAETTEWLSDLGVSRWRYDKSSDSPSLTPQSQLRQICVVDYWREQRLASGAHTHTRTHCVCKWIDWGCGDMLMVISDSHAVSDCAGFSSHSFDMISTGSGIAKSVVEPV